MDESTTLRVASGKRKDYEENGEVKVRRNARNAQAGSGVRAAKSPQGADQ